MQHARPHLQTHGRSKGHSAVAGAAYRLGLRLYDERTKIWHDFRRRKLGEEIVAALAEDGVIKHSVSSSALRDARIFLRIGVALPSRSAAAQAIDTGKELVITDMEATEWSHSDAADRFSVHEEVIHMASWGQTLSLLTFEEDVPAPRSTAYRSEEDDELLSDLTGYATGTWPPPDLSSQLGATTV